MYVQRLVLQIRSLLPPTFTSEPMPLFSNTSGVNINGGNFYEIGGDMHLENNWRQPVIRDSEAHCHDSWAALGASHVQGPLILQHDVGSYTTDGGHSLSGVTRTTQHAGTRRPLPYDIVGIVSVDGSRNVHHDNEPPLTKFMSNGGNVPHADLGFNVGALHSPDQTYYGSRNSYFTALYGHAQFGRQLPAAAVPS
ncbi:hypothetical protein C8J57DRAFT_1632541, partial [Mycena rebaudengoi]